MIAVVDRGVLVAVVNRRDPNHLDCLRVLQDSRLTFVIPVLCIAEASHLILSRAGPQAELSLLQGLSVFSIESPTTSDWPRIRDLVAQYADWPLGTVDASVVALAKRLNADTVVTLDRRHFVPIRPRHCESFRILP